MGRRAPTRMGSRCGDLIALYHGAQPRKAGAILRSSGNPPVYFFGDGEVAGLGAAFG